MGATSNVVDCQKIAPNRSRLSEASIKKKKSHQQILLAPYALPISTPTDDINCN